MYALDAALLTGHNSGFVSANINHDHMDHDHNNNGNFYSALPNKNFTAQGTYKSDSNNNNITQTHTRTHTHAHSLSHMSSFKNYMPPKYTCQKAENQTIGASFALSLSRPPLLAHTQVQVTCSFTGGKVG